MHARNLGTPGTTDVRVRPRRVETRAGAPPARLLRRGPVRANRRVRLRRAGVRGCQSRRDGRVGGAGARHCCRVLRLRPEY